MIYLYLFGTCFHFIYVFMIIGNIETISDIFDKRISTIPINEVAVKRE